MTAAPSRPVRRRRLLATLLAGYLLVLSLIAFWPSPVDEGASAFIARVLRFLHRHGVPGWFDYTLIEFSANVLLFIPLGVLGAASIPQRRVWLILPAGAFASLIAEAGQATFRPERVASPQDVLANTLGAGVGMAAFFLFIFSQSHKRGPTGSGSCGDHPR